MSTTQNDSTAINSTLKYRFWAYSSVVSFRDWSVSSTLLLSIFLLLVFVVHSSFEIQSSPKRSGCTASRFDSFLTTTIHSLVSESIITFTTTSTSYKTWTQKTPPPALKQFFTTKTQNDQQAQTNRSEIYTHQRNKYISKLEKVKSEVKQGPIKHKDFYFNEF